MPQVNLSALSGPELRQMLDASRRRGDAALSYKLLQEMAARRQTPKARGPRLKRRAAEQRLVAVELGEPVETDDDVPPMPNWRPPPEREAAAAPSSGPPARGRRRNSPPARTVASAAAAPAAAADVDPPPPPLEASPPLSLQDDAAATAADPGLRLRPAEPEIPRAPRRSRLPVVAGFALSLAVGVGLGWWGGGIVREAPSPAAPPIRTAALAPAPLPAPTAPSAAEPAPESAPETPPDAAIGPPSPSNAQELARDADGRAPESPPAPPATDAVAAAAPAPDRPAPVVANGCATEPTPADREICGDPQLRLLQRGLQRAYAAALEAHEDRALLRQRQLAWRDARNTVSDPARLARLYQQRIRKLNAATAEARQQR